MKKRVKKLIALLMAAIALSWVVPQGTIDVLAEDINLAWGSTPATVELSADSTDNYVFTSGGRCVLTVNAGVTLSGTVSMDNGYGEVVNKGTITGTISGLKYSSNKVTNESTGTIKSDLTISGGILSNSGTIQSDISILTGTISNSGTLNSVTMKSDSKSQNPTLEMNGGTLTSLKVETGESNPQINLNEGEITTLDMSYGTVEMTGGTVDTLNTGGGTFNPSVNLNGGTVTMLNHRGGFVHIRDGGNVITMDGTGNDTMYGGTITTLNTSGGTFDMFGGTITTLNIIKGKYTMTGGNVDTLNAINGEFIPTIELGGGVVTTLNADGKTVKITGTPIVKNAKASNLSGDGTVTIVDSVELGGSTATVNVKPTTKVKVTGDSGVDVTVVGSNDNKKTVTIPADASVYTPLDLLGKTVTFTTGTGHMSTTDALPTDRYWFGASTEVVTYKADNGYYFPENYGKSDVDCNGTGTTNITRKDASTIQVSYTLGADEADNVTLTLPAATPKANQAAPTDLVGGVKEITGTTNLMEFAKNRDAADSEWSPCTEEATAIPTEGTWYVRYKETEDKLSGEPATVLVLTEGTGSITVADIYYGKQPSPIVNSDTNGTENVRIEYKKKSESDNTYTTVVPTAVGDYTARAIFARQGVYDIAIATDDFSITFMRLAKDPYTISGEMGNNGFYKSIVTVIAEQGFLLAEKLDGDYVSSFAYDTSKEAFSLFAMKQDTGEKSDAIGLAGFKIDMVAPSIDAADGQTYHMDTVEFTITEDNLESVSVNGKNVTVDATGKIAFPSNDGVTDYEVVITDQAGNTKSVNFTVATTKTNQAAPTGLVGGVRKITGTTTLMEYAQNSDADDSAWSPCTEGTTEIPTEGTWYVRYKKTEDKLSGEPADVLVLTEGTGSITVENIYYGKQPSPIVESTTNGTEKVRIEYKKKSETEDKYTTEVPTAVGDYTARASFDSQGVYDGVVATDDFSITFMSLAKAPYMILAEKGNNGFYKSIVEVIAEQGYLLAEKLDGNYVSSLTYDTSKGAFSLFAMKQDTGEKSDAIELAGFKIDMVAPSIDAADGQTYHMDTAEFTITDDNLESVSVNGKNVTVDATGKIAFPSNGGTTNYEVVITDQAGNTKRVSFTVVAPKKNQAAPTGLVGGVKKITGTTTLMEFAQSSDAADSAWSPCTEGTTEIPTEGTWYVRYKETETKLSGQPAGVLVLTEGIGSITVEDIYYGKQPSPSVESTTNGTKNVRIEYKKKSETDDKYTTEVPTAVGDYTARASFAGQGVYDGAVATDDFSITFMRLAKAPYTILAEKGNNGFYKSIVKVIAEQGYLLAEKLDGKYVSSLTYDASKGAFSLFAVKQDTGEKSDAIELAGFKVDRVAPRLDAVDAQTYYTDTVEFAITDDNLESISVNGENVTVDATGKIAFPSNDGVTDYEVVITDQAGNTRRVSFKVASKWTKSGVVPTGQTVLLTTENAYKLGSGTWTVNGDSTSYNGNQNFYVGSEGKYVFTGNE